MPDVVVNRHVRLDSGSVEHWVVKLNNNETVEALLHAPAAGWGRKTAAGRYKSFNARSIPNLATFATKMHIM